MKVNLNKPTGTSSPGSAAPKNEIIFIEAETIVSFPRPDEGGVRLQGSFVLEDDEKMVKVYSTKSKVDAPMETDGDEDMTSFKPKLVLMHPGNKVEVKEFVQFWTGRNIVALHKACGETHYEVMGTPCAPLQLKAAKQDNNDGRGWTLTLEPFAKTGFVPQVYEGAVVFTDPTQVPAGSNLELTTANGLQYEIGADTTGSAIEAAGSVTLEHGQVVTLIGKGGTTPSVLASGVAGVVTTILANATSWTALAKHVIHLKVFKAGATTYLIEVSRDSYL